MPNKSQHNPPLHRTSFQKVIFFFFRIYEIISDDDPGKVLGQLCLSGCDSIVNPLNIRFSNFDEGNNVTYLYYQSSIIYRLPTTISNYNFLLHLPICTYLMGFFSSNLYRYLEKFQLLSLKVICIICMYTYTILHT